MNIESKSIGLADRPTWLPLGRTEWLLFAARLGLPYLIVTAILLVA